MINALIIANKIFEILEKENKLKCSFLKKEENFCYIKVENYKNSNKNCLIIEKDIFFQIDNEEYFNLEKYEEATRIFLNKLANVVDIKISSFDVNGEIIEHGFYSIKSEKIIEETIDKLKNEYSFINRVDKMKVTNFYGDFGFEAKWDGKTFVEITSIKR